MKLDIIFAQIGTPKASTPTAISKFLKDFLSSPQVITLPRLIWLPILNYVILKRRPLKIAKRYIAMEKMYGANPTLAESDKIINFFNSKDSVDIKSHLCYALDRDSILKVRDNLTNDSIRFIIPLFPQYSEATYKLIFDRIHENLNASPVTIFPSIKNFCHQSARHIMENIQNQNIERLYLTFHSYPIKRIKQDDRYYEDCQQTYKNILALLPVEIASITRMSFQSKFGRGKWLGPLIGKNIRDDRNNGIKHFAVYSPSFLIDSIETSWELGIDLKQDIESLGGKLTFIKSLNDDHEWLSHFYNDVVTSIAKPFMN